MAGISLQGRSCTGFSVVWIRPVPLETEMPERLGRWGWFRPTCGQVEGYARFSGFVPWRGDAAGLQAERDKT